MPSHLTVCWRGFLTFSWLSPFSALLSPFSCFSPCPYPPAICPLISLLCAGCCWTFSTCALFSSLPPTLFGLLVAPSCQSLSGQLTGCCRAFPAARTTGKRPSVALFDAPSPLILYTWTVLWTDFVLNRSATHSLVPSFLPSVLPSFLQHSSPNF